MSKLTTLIRRAPKRLTAAVLMVAAAVIIPAAVLAWGPSRTVYHWNGPAADHVVFNSFIDNPVQGDERNFMQVREATASATTYADSISLQGGKEYVINMYYHNNASTTLNDAAHNYKGIAKDAYVKAEIPGLVPNGSNGTVAEGYIGASNASPKQVWDEVAFKNTSGGDIALYYVAGSATIHNFGKTNGKTLSDSIVTNGATIGYDALDGKVPGCNEFSGYVTFKIKAVQSNYTITKQVRVAGQTEYKDSVTANPGDTLEYRIEYKNTGNIQHNNVVIKDTLPAHVSYVAGSTTLKNSNNPNGKSIADGVTTSGVNIGDYKGGANAYVKFQAKVAGESELSCGTNKLTNKATVQVGTGTKQDTADTTVTKECAPGVKYTCDALAITRISRTQFTFKTTYTVENATFKKVTYVIRDSKGTEVDRKDSTDGSLNYVQTKVGKYTVQAIVTVTVDDQDQTVTDEDCQKSFEISKTPPELPHTGMTENIVAIVGLGALIASIAYYVASRRAVNQ